MPRGLIIAQSEGNSKGKMTLEKRLRELEREAPRIGEEDTLRQRFVAAMEEFLAGSGVAKKGVQAVLNQRLVRGKPDARLGGLIFEVKLPKPKGAGIEGAIAQAQGYLTEFPKRHAGKLARGVAYDGLEIALLDEQGKVLSCTEASKQARQLEAWLSGLGGEVVTPEEFVRRLGPNSEMALQFVEGLWSVFQQFRRRGGFVEDVFEVWKGLYGVTTNLNEEGVRGLARSAQQMGIRLKGKAGAEEYLFVVETYLATLLRLIVARVAVQQRLTSFGTLEELLRHRSAIEAVADLEKLVPGVAGVFEEDVFMWPKEAADLDRQVEQELNRCLGDMARTLDDVDLVGVGDDFLRLVYQGFLDPVTRRTLGEFYTSPELVDETLDAVGYTGQVDKKLADITCGSGTFLLRAIKRVIQRNGVKDGLLEKITQNVIGVDIHPFAVAMARVNYLVGIAELLPGARPVRVPIYWADSLLRLTTARETMEGMRPQRTAIIPGLDEKFVLPDHRDVEWSELLHRVKEAVGRLGRGVDVETVWQRFWEDAPQEKYLPYEGTIKKFVGQIVKRHNKGKDMRWVPLLENTLNVEQLRGSCDFVVGNPPWVRIHNISKEIRERLRGEYKVCMSTGWRRGSELGGAGRGFGQQFDYCIAFVERGIELLNEGGRLGFVITSKVMHALYGNALRKTLIDETRILRLSDYSLRAKPLFLDATNYPLIMAVERRAPEEGHKVSVAVTGRRGERREFETLQRDLPLLRYDRESPWVIVWPEVRVAFDTMQARADRKDRLRPLLGENRKHRPGRGVLTSLNGVFIVKRVEPTENREEVVIYAEGYDPTRRQGREYQARVERSLLRPLIRGKNVEAWGYEAEDYILWTHDDASCRVLKEIPEKAQQYFESHSRSLRNRADYREGMPLWQIFRVSASKLGLKVAWQQLSNELGAVFVPAKIADPLLGESTLITLLTAYLIPVPSEITGLVAGAFLNSLPVRVYATSFAERARGGYFRFTSPVIGLIPLPEQVQAVLEENTLTPVVERMLEISRALHASPNRPDRAPLEEELDRLVAGVYGLSDGELAALRLYFDFLRGEGVQPGLIDEEENGEEGE